MSAYLSKEFNRRLGPLRRTCFKYKPFSLKERSLTLALPSGYVSQGNLLLHSVGYVCGDTIDLSLVSHGMRYGRGSRMLHVPRVDEIPDLWTMQRLYSARGYNVSLKEELSRLHHLYLQEGTVEGLLRWHAYLWIHRILRQLPTISMVWTLPCRLKDPASYCSFLLTQADGWYAELLGVL